MADRTVYQVGRNISAEIRDKKLVLTIDLEGQGARSASGKNVVIATTSGNVTVPGLSGKLGINYYVPA